MASWLDSLCHTRFWVFIWVGSVNTAIGYAIFGLAYEVVGWHYNVALAVAYGIGIVIAYVNHRRVTFRSRVGHRQAFGRFVMTYVLMYGMNAVLLTLLTQHMGLNPLWGQFIALVVVTLLSFVVQRLWVFRS